MDKPMIYATVYFGREETHPAYVFKHVSFGVIAKLVEDKWLDMGFKSKPHICLHYGEKSK